LEFFVLTMYFRKKRKPILPDWAEPVGPTQPAPAQPGLPKPIGHRGHGLHGQDTRRRRLWLPCQAKSRPSRPIKLWPRAPRPSSLSRPRKTAPPAAQHRRRTEPPAGFRSRPRVFSAGEHLTTIPTTSSSYSPPWTNPRPPLAPAVWPPRTAAAPCCWFEQR
jgi:hypothetical protein